MANMSLIVIITYLSFLSLLSSSCYSFKPKQLLNVSKAYQTTDSSYYPPDSTDWSTTDGTWYGGATAAGSDGGACGYRNAVESAPFNALITAAGDSLFKNGVGCGDCYQVKCTSSVYCSGNPVTVVITDSCSGCDHLFDLSGTSFGAMAISGQEDNLRNAGRLGIQYKIVDCKFAGVEVTFSVEDGSGLNYFAMSVEFEDGFGISGVAIKKAYSSDAWRPLTQLWGSVFKVDLPQGYPAPYDVQLSNGKQTIVAENIIPGDFKPDKAYKSHVNFNV